MIEKDAKPVVMRNEKGQLLPGFTANPHGKPKGSRHLTTLLREAIEKISSDEDEPADRLIVKKLVQMAKSGDMRAIELVLDRIDGKASQAVVLENNAVGLTDEQREKLDDLLRI